MVEPGLEPLVTDCPECRTRFRVTHAQLELANGKVRCGVCRGVFLAVDSLVIGENDVKREAMDDSALDHLLDELETPPDSSSTNQATNHSKIDSGSSPTRSQTDSVRGENQGQSEFRPQAQSQVDRSDADHFVQSIGADLKNRMRVAARNAQALNLEFGNVYYDQDDISIQITPEPVLVPEEPELEETPVVPSDLDRLKKSLEVIPGDEANERLESDFNNVIESILDSQIQESKSQVSKSQ
ncbi:MAG: hypothetical protein KUG75_08905, partial [Pseudomonadales bacterium]|nr:hypothetical protein [Pseudomonadales bacterium]